MQASTATQCTIPVAVLTGTPFSLAWGDSVSANVIAVNAYGNSVVSPDGNGATIITTPDSPITLVELIAQRTTSTLGLSWSDGSSDGGSEVIDYRVQMA